MALLAHPRPRRLGRGVERARQVHADDLGPQSLRGVVLDRPPVVDAPTQCTNTSRPPSPSPGTLTTASRDAAGSLRSAGAANGHPVVEPGHRVVCLTSTTATAAPAPRNPLPRARGRSCPAPPGDEDALPPSSPSQSDTRGRLPVREHVQRACPLPELGTVAECGVPPGSVASSPASRWTGSPAHHEIDRSLEHRRDLVLGVMVLLPARARPVAIRAWRSAAECERSRRRSLDALPRTPARSSRSSAAYPSSGGLLHTV